MRIACSRCDKTPVYPDYISGNERLCRSCDREEYAKHQARLLEKAEIEATKERHPAGKAKTRKHVVDLSTESRFVPALDEMGEDF